MPISSAIKSGLADGTGIYITLVKVEKGTDVVAYALHTRDVTFEGTTYEAAPFEPSKMQQSSGVAVDNATITHILGDLFTRNNIKGSKWTGAKITLLAVDLTRLSDGPARAHYGRLGTVTAMGPKAETEYRGLMQLLNQEIGDRTSRRCRYQLGDANCTVNIADFTISKTVTAVTDNQQFTVSGPLDDDFYKYGKAVWTSGNNNGLEMEIITNTGGLMTLYLPMPGDIQIGDGVNLIAGDDKTLLTCHTKFDNAINHGGEDGLPNPDQVFTFPS